MVAVLMVSAKLATLSVFKIKVFWNKEDQVIIYAPDVTSKVLSRDSNCIVDVVMRPKLGSIKEVAITST